MMQESISGTDQTKRRFAAQLPRNLAANLTYFLINIVIGIFLVPYFIDTLGVAAYGLIPLATSITGHVAIVVQSLNIAVSRFLAIDLQREDYAAANKTFNTALIGLTGIILLMVPVILVIVYFIPSVFHVPSGQEDDAGLLFLGVSAAFLIRSWSGNFTVQLFAYNRIDLQNVVNLTNLIIQTVLIVLLLTLVGPNVAFIGGAYLAGAAVASGVAIIFARRICPNLRISISSFDPEKVRSLCGMGGWVFVNNIGSHLFLQIDIIVVNLLFGATSAGQYAIALQWVILLRAITGLLSGNLVPAIFSCYAQKQVGILIQFSKSAVKLMGLAMALPIGLICGLAPDLLTLWVGEEFAFLWPLMVLLTLHLTVNLAVLPLFSINVAYNRVRVPGIVTLLMGIANFGLAVVLPLLTGMGYYGVAAAGAIVLTLKNAFFTPWYAAKVMGVSAHTYNQSMLPGIVATGLICVSAAALRVVLPFPINVAIISAAIALVYLAAIWAFGLNGSERKLFASYLPPAVRRIIV